MSTRTVLFDDLDQSQGAETIRFAVEDRRYEIDLSAANRTRFDKALEPFIAVARQVGGRKSRSRTGPSNAAVREWAAANNFEVSRSGRVPAHVVEAYQSGQGSRSARTPGIHTVSAPPPG